MLTKKVQSTEDINYVVNGTFIFCQELGKGLVKRNFDALNISDYSFISIVNKIESLTTTELVALHLDSVLFSQGEIVISKLLTDKIMQEAAVVIPVGSHSSDVDAFYTNKKAKSRYFDVARLSQYKELLNNTNFISDTNVSIIENIEIGTAVSGNLILINMDNYEYQLLNYNNEFEFINGRLKTKGIIDYETRLNYALQMKVVDKSDETKFWLDTVNIDVINVPDTIAINTLRSFSVDENSPIDTIIGDLTTLFTKESGLNVGFSILDTSSSFKIINNNLAVKNILDYETSPAYVVTVRITNTDDTTMFWDMDVNVTVIDVVETVILDSSKSAITDIFGDGSGVALYCLDGNANDESGNYHGTETAITYGGGVYGRGAVFNGSTSNISLSGMVDFGTTGVSVSCWVRPSALPVSSICVGLYTNDGVLFGFNNNGYLFTSGQSNITTTSNPLTINNWHFCTFTITSGGQLSFYKDGVLISTHAGQTSAFNQVLRTNTIGAYATNVSGGRDGFLNGSMDQVRIFNRAITATEVKSLFKEPKPTSTVTFPTRVIDKLPLAHYKFEGDAKDAMGTYNGTATNVTYAPGKFGTAAVFNGSNSYVTLGTLEIANAMSVSLHFKLLSTPSTNQAILFNLAGDAYSPQMYIQISSAGTITGSLRDTTPTVTKAVSTPYGTLNEWHHVCFVRDGTKTFLYLDGVLVSTETGSIAGSYGNALASLGRYIGAGDASPLAGTYFNGSIDQLRIFNSALTQEEVTALFNEQPPADTIDDAIAHYKLDGNAEDALGNYNGVATNVTYLDSKFGKAGVFNGSTSGVSLPSSLYATLSSNNQTISVWVKFSTVGLDNILCGESNTTGSASTTLRVVSGNRFQGTSQTGVDVTSTTVVTAGVWYHVVYVRNPSTSHLYVNGSLEATETTVAAGNIVRANIGRWGFSDANTVDGQIDQVKIYNRALNATEVGMLFNEASPIETVSYTKPVIQNDAIAHYKLDGDTKDAMGTYNGTATAVTYVDGKFGKCAVFNGSNSRISLGSFLTVTNSYSFSIWVKTTSLSKYIVDLYGWGGELSTTNQGYALFQIYNGTTWSSITSITSTQSISDNLWHNIVCLHDASAKAIKMYIDGTFVNSVSYTGTIRTIGSISIGSTYVPDIFFNGSIDQLRFYDRALGQSEVTALFNEVLPTNTKNLLLDEAVAYYKMDGNVNDSMGNYNGTATALTYADGKFGGAAVFNGTSSYINVGNVIGISNFSISVWFKTSSTSHMEIASDCDSVAINYLSSSFEIRISTGSVNVQISTTSNTAVSLLDSSATYADGNWHHIVLTGNGNTYEAYLDGVKGTTGTATRNAENQPIYMGRLGAYNGRYFTGSIDQVRIYDRAITASEVTTLFNEAAPTSIVDNINPFNDGSCKAMYQFNGDATDKTGVYNGTATNVTYGTGKFGQCAMFNGTSSYVDTGYVVPALPTLSCSMWVKMNSGTTASQAFAVDATVAGTMIPCRLHFGVSSGAFYLAIGNGSTNWSNNALSSSILNDNIRHHLVLTINSTSVKVYVDGILLHSVTSTVALGTLGTQQVVIGRYGAANAWYHNGTIEQTRFFNKALTSQEIQDLFIEGQYPRVTLPAIELDPFKDNSCKALYKFEGNALDSNGKYDGVATNVSYATGKFGQCVVLADTATSYVEMPYDIIPLGNKTISFWMKTTETDCIVMGKQDGSSASTGNFSIQQLAGHPRMVYSIGGNWNWISDATTLVNDKNWHHVVCVMDYTNLQGYFYVDGKKEGVDTFSGTDAVLNSPVRIGQGVSSVVYFGGSIDHFRVFNRVLTQSEVQSLFIEGQYNKAELPALELQPFADKSCKSYYKFDGNVLDSLGNSNGVATNVSYAQSKFGQAAFFNGTSSKVDVPFGLTANFNISLWFKTSVGGGLCSFSTYTTPGNELSNFSFRPSVRIGTGELEIWAYQWNGSRNDFNVTIAKDFRDNGWHHLYVNLNSNTKTGIAYVDGTYAGTDTFGVDYMTYAYKPNGLIGQGTYQFTVSGGYFNGGIDQVRTFDKLLTPMEVASLFNETTPTEFPMSHQVDPFKDGSGKALYKLDGNALDESGKFNGTATSVTYGVGKSGRSGMFNGGAQITTTYPFFSQPSRSASFWIKTTFDTNLRMIYGNTGAGGVGYTAITITGKLQIASVNNTIVLESTGIFADGNWHHAVLTETNGSTKMYIDGILNNSTTTFGGTIAGSLMIGTWGHNTSQKLINGTLLEQFRVFDRVLTAEEVQTLYKEI